MSWPENGSWDGMAYLNHVWLSICGDRLFPPGFSIRVFTYVQPPVSLRLGSGFEPIDVDVLLEQLLFFVCDLPLAAHDLLERGLL